MHQFKPRPPLIEGIRYDGGQDDAMRVIRELAERDITASYIPDLEKQLHSEREAKMVPGHILILSRGRDVKQLHPGEWIIWDPQLHDGSIQSWHQFDVMLDTDVERRYMDRKEGE